MNQKRHGVRLSRDAYLILAAEYEQFGRDLLWLAGRSLDCVRGSLEGKDLVADGLKEPSWSALGGMQRARGKAESKLLDDPDASGRGTIADAMSDEFHCIVDTLMFRATALRKEAETLTRDAASIKRGRPRKRRGNPLVQIAGLLGPVASRSKPGRKPLVALDDDQLLEIVEKGHQEYGESTRETLRLVVDCYMSKRDPVPPSEWRRNLEAARLLANLEKRVSALRSRLRKLHAK